MTRPKLNDGYKYGKSITWQEVNPGDFFQFTGSKASGRTSGRIVKVNRVTIVCVGGVHDSYKIHKDYFIGGTVYICKDKLVHSIKN